MAMELKHLNPQHVMDVTGKAIDEISRLRAENAELKRKLQDQCISCPVKMQEDAAIAELKLKLEDAKATAYAESVDAGMENRRLKRALWLSRAKRALEKRDKMEKCRQDCMVEYGVINNGYSLHIHLPYEFKAPTGHKIKEAK